MYLPAGGNLPSVEKVGLRERLGLKDLRLDRGVVEVDREGFTRGGRCAMGRVRGQGAGPSPPGALRGGVAEGGAVVSSVVGQRSHWELLLMMLWMFSDSDRMELAVLSWLMVLP